MAENSIFWTTNNVGDGPAAGFSSSDIFEVYRSLLTGSVGANYGGISPDYLNELAVTGATSPVSVATGAALVYGIPYFNSAGVNVTVPTPASSTRIDRIVLRADWSAQTVRITRVAGTEGAGSAPALTQSAGVTWDIPLARVTITTAGSITLTDDRQYLSLIGDSAVVTAKLNDLAVTTAKLADAGVTTVKIADSNVTTVKLADSGVTTAKIADSNVTTAKIADSNVTTAKIADSNVTSAKVADDAISNAKLANMAQTTVKGRTAGSGTGDPVDLTAAQLVDILETADGSGSGLDADTVDGLHASSFWQASNDGSGSGLDADLLDGQHGSYYLPASSYTASDVLTKIKTVDGTGSGLDADLLDGQSSAYYAVASHDHIDVDFTTWHTGTVNNCTVIFSYAQKFENLVFFHVRFDVTTAGNDVYIPISSSFTPYNAAGGGSYSGYAMNVFHAGTYSGDIYAKVDTFGNRLYVYGTNLGSGIYEVSGVYRAE